MIILVGSTGSGKSRLARANKDFSFIEIQSDDKGWNTGSFGLLYVINLNELGIDKAQKFIDFIRKSFGAQIVAAKEVDKKQDYNRKWKMGDKAFFRMPYEKCKQWYVCVNECEGSPRENDECFKPANTQLFVDNDWNVGDEAFFRMPFEENRSWHKCIIPCSGYPQENIECFK